jgi:small subunit ribosomal protein S17
MIKRTAKIYAHDEERQAHVGDLVKVMSTRPISKMKRWRVVEILEKAK